MAGQKYLTSLVKQLIVNAATPSKSEIGKIFALKKQTIHQLSKHSHSKGSQSKEVWQTKNNDRKRRHIAC